MKPAIDEREEASARLSSKAGRWAPLVFTGMLLLLAVLPDGPLAFLPPVVRFPLVFAAFAGWVLTLDRTGQAMLEGGGLLLVFGTFLLLKLPGIHASGTDDNIYFYMADAMTRGRLPYRDFFFSHPPVHLLVPAAVFGVGGFSIGLAKAIPVLATAAASAFLYLAARPTSRAFALLVVLFHLTTYQVLMASSDMNGENLMTAFLAAGLWALVAGRPTLSGAMAGLGLGCGLYALAAVLALAAMAGSRRAAARYAAGVLLSFGGVMLVFFALAPEGLLDGVFRYHLDKPARDGRAPVFESANPLRILSALAGNLTAWLSGKDASRSLHYHSLHVLALAAFTATMMMRFWQRRRAEASPPETTDRTPDFFARLALVSTLLFVGQWSALNETYDYYQVPMLTFMAFLPAWAAWRLHETVRQATRGSDVAAAAALLGILCLHAPWTQALANRLWPEEQAKAGERVTYQWRDPEILQGLARTSRALFFSDHRIRGKTSPHYRHALWNKLLTFASAHEVAAHVRAHTSPDETITGASTLAPLVALLADRRMAGDEADTNGKRFRSGHLTLPAFVDTICEDKVRYVLASARSPFSEAFMSRTPGFSGVFLPERTFQDSGLLHFREQQISLYRRVDGLESDGRVCPATSGT